MSISTYNELQDALTNYTHRSGLTARIPEFIAMAESHLNRKLRAREMEESATITPSQSVRYVALPDGFMELISFTDSYNEPLVALDSESLDRAAYAIGAQEPRFFRITSRIDYEAVADRAYSHNIRYWKRLDLETDITNSVLTNHPDAYLYASLAQAAMFAQNTDSAAGYMQMRDSIIRDINNQASRDTQTLRTGIPSRGSANILSDR